MSLKILGGKFRGRLLSSPKTKTTRPTLAVLRQAVFNIVQQDIEGTAVLDLYAGSGAMGLEALSHGAKSATFVEADKAAFRCLAKNVALLEVEAQCTLISYDALLALKTLVKTAQQFDLVYIDPPYAPAAKLKLLEELLTFFDTHSLMKPKGRLFLEEAAPGVLNPEQLVFHHLHYVDSRKFSQSLLHQFSSKCS